MSNRKAVGIDLGTTFSAVAHIDAYGKPQITPNTESERITPSVILFDGASITNVNRGIHVGHGKDRGKREDSTGGCQQSCALI